MKPGFAAPCRGVLSLFCTFITLTLPAVDVSYYGVIKSSQYEQTNGASPVLLTSNAFMFNAFAVATTNGVLTNATVKPSNSTPLRQLLPETNSIGWRYSSSFNTQSEMDTVYPAGTAFNQVNYTLTLSCSNDGVRSGSVSFFLLFVPINYPPIPELTNLATGQNIDTTREFRLGWKSLGGSSLTLVQLTLMDPSSNVVYSSALPFSAGALDGSSMGVAVPAHTLPSGSTIIGHLTAANPGLPNTNSYPGAVGVAALARDTEFRLVTRPAPGSPRLSLVEPLGPPLNLRLEGESNRLYQIEASPDLTNWTHLATIYTPTTVFDYQDTNAIAHSRRYYRARVGE